MRPLSVSSIPEIGILAAMVVFWAVMIVATYLTSADVLFAKRAPETRRERLVTTCALATLGSFIAATVLAPPNPFSQILWHLGGLVVTGPAAVLYVTYGATLRDDL
ncbi:hypothetical protein SAMN05216388_1010166 [Halorientalis persicus]|uniref:Uncharacterized protein n=1 Tax=Halorientalis persicus TaxID=1367881 RepID=A0A1H8NI20_9EURY|nr:hypothetical protein [Halorientalis persicus]SEO29244.1 hypothetical protein SAMN05216388_1010166 [Halorientalis persicus]